MSRVTVYSTANCPYCTNVKALLEKWRIAFDEVRIDTDQAAMKQFAEVTGGARTVPQIVIDGEAIGGFDELTEMHMDGELDALIQSD